MTTSKRIRKDPEFTGPFADMCRAFVQYKRDQGFQYNGSINILHSFDNFSNPAVVRLTGKGSRVRNVPLLKGNVQILSAYVHDNQRRLAHKDDVLFVNHSGQRMTRAGICYILRKNADAARLLHPELIPEKLTPHCLRHSKAMHLLQAGVNLIYIRDFLGHTDVKTTQIYARADVTLKRQAIEDRKSVV